MTNTRPVRLKNLGEVEQLVMDYLWAHGPSSSEACREALAASRPMKDSTIRTVLRRLEEKGYVTHEIDGRTFIYKASDARPERRRARGEEHHRPLLRRIGRAARARNGRQRGARPQATGTAGPQDRTKKELRGSRFRKKGKEAMTQCLQFPPPRSRSRTR